VKSAATVAAVAAAVPLQPLLGGKESVAEASVIDFNSSNRANACFNFRTRTAKTQHIDIGVQPDNGDAARFTDHSATWSKALVHDDLQNVNEASYRSITKALSRGSSK